ncbi:MAG: ABC transporter permease [Sphingobacteriia bacterium]|nr:ABC transporter permease [Sphingobacteriia bacterium]
MFDLDRWTEIYQTLAKNKLRTALTAFGVFWGIFMLIIMLGAGRGLEHGIQKGMGDMATNSMFMWTQRTSMPYKGFPRGRFFNFNNEDTRAMLQQIPEISQIAPRIQGYAQDGNNNVVRNERTGAYTIQGDMPAYNIIDPVKVTKGRFLNPNDVNSNRKVAVLGKKVVADLYKADEDPINTYIRLQGVYFQVIGVFESRKNDNQAEYDNQNIIIPFTTLQKTYNYGDAVGWYSITAKKGIPVSQMEAKIKQFLMKRHDIHPEDTRAIGSWNVEKEFTKMNNLFTGIAGLIWIVGIGTLLAGVIGISNIMLVVVRERTREIGIQRAIGARPAVIIGQILSESTILTLIAGYAGLVAGVAIVELVNYLLSMSGGNTGMFANPEVDFSIAITALIVIVFCGLIAGIIPARKAIKIKPIEALRYE